MTRRMGTPFTAASILCITALLAACSSSGDGDDGGANQPPGSSQPPNPPPPQNRAPVSVAGADATGQTGDTLTLDGTGSSDPDGNPITYSWSIISGPANGATLTNSTSATAQFRATIAGTYVVQLEVRDSQNASGTDTLTIVITDPPPPAVATITLNTPYVFLTGAGQKGQLTAELLDSQGQPVTTNVTWVSSAPDQVDVDADGLVTAIRIGSAQISAHVGRTTSAPALIVVAEPMPGALLVTDEQIESVGAPIGLQPDETPGVGTEYEVWLRNVDEAPAPGTVVLAAETSLVAGKVVSTREENGALVVRLALAPLHEMLARYNIDWEIDLSSYPLTADEPVVTMAKHALARRAADTIQDDDSPVKEFKRFECDGNLGASLGGTEASITATPGLKLVLQDYRDDPTLPPNYSKHMLQGSLKLEGEAKVTFKPNISASGTCRAQGHFELPVFGWVSLIVMPQVRVGVGFELNVTLIVADGELSGKLKFELTPTMGWECGGAQAECRSLDDITFDYEFQPKQTIPSVNQMHVEGHGQLFAFATLDASLFSGLGGYVEIVEARMGPKQSFDLGFEPTQAANDDYASSYDLKLEWVVKPGSGLKSAIEKALGKDIDLTFKAKNSLDLAESPKGTLEVSKTRVGLGDSVDFTARITPESTRRYLGVGEDVGMAYNIDFVELWRKRDDEEEFSFWRTFEFTQSGEQTVFTYRWTPEPADVGKWKFAAFVDTKLPVPHLELAPNAVRDVEVSCFSAGAKPRVMKKGAEVANDPNTCADTWVGTTSGYIVDQLEINGTNITWQIDPDFWQCEEGVPDCPPAGKVAYYATGTVVARNILYESLGCTLSQNEFDLQDNHPSDRANSLVVDYSTSPATFSGLGTVDRLVTVTCNGNSMEIPVHYPWFGGSGEVTENGMVIEGSTTTPVAGSSFRFTRP